MAYEGSGVAEDAAKRLLDSGAILMDAWHELAWEDRQRVVVDLTMLAGTLRNTMVREPLGDGPSADAVRAELDERCGSIHLQPIVRLPARDVVGYEALSRFSTWTPDRWFRQAWTIGVGLEFELDAVRRAIGVMASLPEPLFLGVNVSPLTLVSGALLEVLEDCDTRRLVLELTEHAAIADYSAYHEQIAKLRGRGVRLAIDDVGAGHSSLLHIVQLRPDVIKVDRSLIAGCDADPVRRVLMQCFETLARHTQAHLVGEGVETDAEADALVCSGVTFAQGYLFGHPQPSVVHTPSVCRPKPVGASWPPPFAE